MALDEGRVVAYASYLLTQYDDVEEVVSIGEAVVRFEQVAGSADAYGPAKAKVGVVLREVRKRVESRVGALDWQLIPQEKLDRLREW